MKHLEVGQKYSAACLIFNSLLSVAFIASHADSRNWDDGIKNNVTWLLRGQTSDIKNLPIQEIAAEFVYSGQKKMKNLLS